MKVLLIFGTRPEAIKMAPVLKELARRRDAVDSVVSPVSSASPGSPFGDGHAAERIVRILVERTRADSV